MRRETSINREPTMTRIQVGQDPDQLNLGIRLDEHEILRP